METINDTKDHTEANARPLHPFVRPLGASEYSRLEPLLPPCPRCGAVAEMRTASWTSIDYIRCSKKCHGVHTYEPEAMREGGRFIGKTRPKAWEDNLALWMSWANEKSSDLRP